MSSRDQKPTWHGTPLDSPVTRVATPLFAVREGELYPSGTACIIGPWLAITARHVVERHFAYFGKQVTPETREASHLTHTYVVPGDDGQPMLPLTVYRTWFHTGCDIAVLWLAAAAEADPKRVWACPPLSLLPPRIGSRIVAFGYPNSTAEMEAPNKAVVNMDATTSTGTVIEIHHQARDSIKYPFPCFRTNARFDSGMSGGPVFDEQGRLCGIVCGSVPPYDESEEHASYVSILWPLLSVLIDAPWDHHPPGSKYPMLEYAKAGIVDAVDLDQLTLVQTADGFGCRYDIGAYSVSDT